MIADANRTIIYMNRSVEAMLRRLKVKFARFYPISPWIRSSVVLWISSTVIRRIKRVCFDKLDRKYESQIKVASCHFRLTASPIIAKSGERLGTVVEWLDRTEEN